MKKIILFVLCIALLAGIAVGCSSAKSTLNITDYETEEIGEVQDDAPQNDDQPQKEDSKTDIKGDLKVHFLNVGQGDSEFIEFADGTCMLIDAGEKEYGEFVLDYIKNLGYEKIDYVVATHPHSDHIGGMPYVLNNIEVGNVFLPNITHDSVTFEKMLEAIDNHNINAVITDNTTQIKEGITVLSPIKDVEYEDLNDWSIVLHLKYGNTSFMFTGDAEETAEGYFTGDLSAYVLKMGHHGSSTSSSDDFLNKVNPTYVVVSCGANNKYGHPHLETVKKVRERDCKAFATYANGTITAVSDGKGIIFDCEPVELIPGATVDNSGIESADDESEEDSISETFVGNKNSKKYHTEECTSVEKMSQGNKVNFSSCDEAESAGYTPCGSCHPRG